MSAAILIRIGIVIFELVGEALLLGVLLGLVLVPKDLSALAVGSLPVVLILFLHGYYLTRPILGLAWRSASVWLYALIAAALFTIHMLVGYARLSPDMGQVGPTAVVTFFVGGPIVVFGCAYIGHRWLGQKLIRRT